MLTFDEKKRAFQPVNTVELGGISILSDVKFRIAYTDSTILIHYKIKKEASVRAMSLKTTGRFGKMPVWSSFHSCQDRYIITWNVTVLEDCLSVREQDASPSTCTAGGCLIKCWRWSSLGQEILRNG